MSGVPACGLHHRSEITVSEFTIGDFFANWMPLPRTAGDPTIIEQSHDMCRHLGVDPDTSFEAVRHWLAWGAAVEGLAGSAPQGVPDE